MIVDFSGQNLDVGASRNLLIGTKGRIDMKRAREGAQFILADKNSKGMKMNVSVQIEGE